MTLLDLIQQSLDLSELCKGQCSTYITSEKKHYCTLAKGFPSPRLHINCKHLYHYSRFSNGCLYQPKVN